MRVRLTTFTMRLTTITMGLTTSTMSSKQNKINHLQDNYADGKFNQNQNQRHHFNCKTIIDSLLFFDVQSISLSVSLCSSLSFCPSLCLLFCLSFCLSLCLHLRTCLSKCLSLHLSDRSHAAPGLGLCLSRCCCDRSPSRGCHLSHHRAWRHPPLLSTFI